MNTPILISYAEGLNPSRNIQAFVAAFLAELIQRSDTKTWDKISDMCLGVDSLPPDVAVNAGFSKDSFLVTCGLSINNRGTAVQVALQKNAATFTAAFIKTLPMHPVTGNINNIITQIALEVWREIQKEAEK